MDRDPFARLKIELALILVLMVPVLVLSLRLPGPWDFLLALCFGVVSASILFVRIRHRTRGIAEEGHD